MPLQTAKASSLFNAINEPLTKNRIDWDNFGIVLV